MTACAICCNAALSCMDFPPGTQRGIRRFYIRHHNLRPSVRGHSVWISLTHWHSGLTTLHSKLTMPSKSECDALTFVTATAGGHPGWAHTGYAVPHAPRSKLAMWHHRTLAHDTWSVTRCTGASYSLSLSLLMRMAEHVQ